MHDLPLKELAVRQDTVTHDGHSLFQTHTNVWEIVNHYDIGYTNNIDTLKEAVRQFDKFPYTKVADVMQDDLRTQLKLYLGYKEIPYNKEVAQMLYRLCYAYPTNGMVKQKIDLIHHLYMTLCQSYKELSGEERLAKFSEVADYIYEFPRQYLWILWSFLNRSTMMLYTHTQRTEILALLDYLEKSKPATIDDFDTVFCSDIMVITTLTHRHPEMWYALSQGVKTLDVFYSLEKRSQRFPIDVRYEALQRLDSDAKLFDTTLRQQTEARLIAGKFDTLLPVNEVTETKTIEEYQEMLLVYYHHYLNEKTHLRELLELTAYLRSLPYSEISSHSELIVLLSRIDQLTFKVDDPQLFIL